MFNFDQYDWLNDTSFLGTKFGFQGLGGFGLQPEVDGSADKGAYEDYVDSSLYGTRRLVRQPDGRIDVVWEPGTPSVSENKSTEKPVKDKKPKSNQGPRFGGSSGGGGGQPYLSPSFEPIPWGTGVLEQLFGFESKISQVLDKIPGTEVAKNIVAKASDYLEKKFGPAANRPKDAPSVVDIVNTQIYPDSSVSQEIVQRLPELSLERFSQNPDLSLNSVDMSTPEFLATGAKNPTVTDLPSKPLPSYETNMGKRSEIPSSGIADKVANVVHELYGDQYKTVLYSGQEPEGIAPVGTPDRHPRGFAGDFYFVDSQGSMVTDPEVLTNIAQGAAAMYDMNIGFGGDGYMSQGRLHLDTMPVSGNQGLMALNKDIYPGGRQWGDLPPGFTETLDMARAADFMPQMYYDQRLTDNIDTIPQPKWSPERPIDTTLTRVPNDQMRQFEGMPPTAASIAKTQGKDLTETERSALMTIMANEFDHNKTKLDSPEGQREMAMIISTALNRSAEKNIPLEVLAEDNNTFSNITNNTDVQRSNLVKHGSEMAGFLDTYFDPTKSISGFDPTITHYFNDNIVTPSWASAGDFDKFGAHVGADLRPAEPHMWGKGPVGTPQQIDQYATDMTNYYVGEGFASPDYNRVTSFSNTTGDPGRSVYESSNTSGDYGRNSDNSSYSSNAYSPGGMVGHPSGGSAKSGYPSSSTYESSNTSGDYGRNSTGSSYSDNAYSPGGMVGHPSGGSAKSGYPSSSSSSVKASSSSSSSSSASASTSGSANVGKGIGASGSANASVGSSASTSNSTPSDISSWDAWI